MTDNHLTTLQQEWTTLQNQSDSYEKLSLLIKLVNITITLLLLFEFHAGLWALFICAMLWLQDGIWKTFQSRMAIRIVYVEKAIEKLILAESIEPSTIVGMQFNTNWVQSKPGAAGLITEYATQALKPTVAYPHILLVAMILVKLYS